MSFAEQERVMFDLLFDQNLRNNFCSNSVDALSEYELNEDELNDFKTVRPEALELDASIRCYLILTQLCRQFPVTFSLLSSINQGKDILKSLVNLNVMQVEANEREVTFGNLLREKLTRTKLIDSEKEQLFMSAILEAELGMAMTSASLKQQVLFGESYSNEKQELVSDWIHKPVKLASYVSAAMVPFSYAKLKLSLCQGADTELWARLSKKGTSASYRRKMLSKENPILFISRANVSNATVCDVTVDHQTAELTEGFAPLFQHINGVNSIGQLLEHLKQAGAPEQILQGVKSGFEQLLNTQMLEFA